ncbi:MAG: hypothetical protein LR015_13865 [Verrucomicrobia bacterium]|nr:hypothetical protein [Verrucomicrobiota bacterium]
MPSVFFYDNPFYQGTKMAIIIEANYGKKIGLPQFSSHSFQVAVKSEVQSMSEITEEVECLYRILQESVDQNIKEAGVTPETLQSAKPAQTAAPAEQRRIVASPANHEPKCSP